MRESDSSRYSGRLGRRRQSLKAWLLRNRTLLDFPVSILLGAMALALTGVGVFIAIQANRISGNELKQLQIQTAMQTAEAEPFFTVRLVACQPEDSYSTAELPPTRWHTVPYDYRLEIENRRAPVRRLLVEWGDFLNVRYQSSSGIAEEWAVRVQYFGTCDYTGNPTGVVAVLRRYDQPGRETRSLGEQIRSVEDCRFADLIGEEASFASLVTIRYETGLGEERVEYRIVLPNQPEGIPVDTLERLSESASYPVGLSLSSCSCQDILKAASESSFDALQ